MNMQTLKPKPADIDKCASTWFLRLEAAVNAGDSKTAKEAQSELKQLGFIVTVRRKGNV
jgi:hypothetical protein